MADYRIIFTRNRLGEENYRPEVRHGWLPIWWPLQTYCHSDNRARELIHNHAHPRIVREVSWRGTTRDA